MQEAAPGRLWGSPGALWVGKVQSYRSIQVATSLIKQLLRTLLRAGKDVPQQEHRRPAGRQRRRRGRWQRRYQVKVTFLSLRSDLSSRTKTKRSAGSSSAHMF